MGGVGGYIVGVFMVTECGVDSDYRDNGGGRVVRGFTVGETVLTMVIGVEVGGGE